MYFIENDMLRVRIKQKGAELASLVALETGQEYIWEADPKYWGRHSCILFPIIGALREDRYEFEGKSYFMKKHGFARNTDFEVKNQQKNQISFTLSHSADTLAIYPFQFELIADYQLVGGELKITYQVVNKDNRSIYFSLGGHPAFNCPVDRGTEERADYQLVFEQSETIDRQLLDVKTGLRTGEKRTMLKDENAITISKNLFEEDALIFEQLKSDKVHLMHKNGEKVLTFHFEGFPFLGIWSKNDASSYVCLEPWHGVADSTTHNFDFKQKEGIIALEKGYIFECTHSVSID